MGSFLEINDTLQITVEQGFPVDILLLENHIKEPIKLSDVQGKVFSFRKKTGARIFQLDPVRVYFVQNLNNKWLFWGKILVQSQAISKKLDDGGNWIKDSWETSGTYIISDIYDPAYQQVFTRRESPSGLSYFGD